ncbi:MAG: multifunctional CCA addition/repair protein [Zoogloeaceae bacterium]|jgi:tRNA nucleotidyltransferase (CCA-adding enzyme)|nr:multifunctional CCA addition/repair protein [Zoogloeaceae bacterium]
MKIYRVGGAVRDALLGRPASDCDYVVVGARPKELLALGFLPVGKDFPVFLHPETHAEYALARTERKHGHGYHGFVFHTAPNVTLEEDLARRDLTINAMAEDRNGRLIDPFGGRGDLQNKVLRHVSDAFAEDPVRILRLARFAARFGDFSVAPETLALARDMVRAGEVDHLVAERVWQEIARGLMEEHPERMFKVLRRCGALARLLPEVDQLFSVPERSDYHPEGNSGEHVLLVLAQAARMQLPLAARFGALTHDLGKGLTPHAEWPSHRGHDARGEVLVLALSERLKIPAELRETGRLAAREHIQIHRLAVRRNAEQAEAMTALLERCDVLRRPARFEALLLACESDHRGRLGWAEKPWPQGAIWRRAAAAVRNLNAGAIAHAAPTPADIPHHLHAARVAAVQAALAEG